MEAPRSGWGVQFSSRNLYVPFFFFSGFTPDDLRLTSLLSRSNQKGAPRERATPVSTMPRIFFTHDRESAPLSHTRLQPIKGWTALSSAAVRVLGEGGAG